VRKHSDLHKPHWGGGGGGGGGGGRFVDASTGKGAPTVVSAEKGPVSLAKEDWSRQVKNQ